MLNPFTIRGRIIDLRRFANANRHRHPFAPAERYELWLKKFDGIECKLTIQTKSMPARSGHGISVIVAGDEEREEDDDPSLLPVVAVFNRETGAAANYLRTETPPFLRRVDFAVVTAGFAALAWGGAAPKACCCSRRRRRSICSLVRFAGRSGWHWTHGRLIAPSPWSGFALASGRKNHDHPIRQQGSLDAL